MGNNAHVDDSHGGWELTCKDINAGPPSHERLHHLACNLLWKGTHALIRHSVVSGHNKEGLLAYVRLEMGKYSTQLFCNFMQPPERARRHNELRCMLSCRIEHIPVNVPDSLYYIV